MGKDRHSLELENAHNKGEQDAAKGINNEPYGIVDSVVSGLLGKDTKEISEENEAYRAGRKNHFDSK